MNQQTKIKKIGKVTACGILALGMVVCSCADAGTVVEAKKVSKQETVFVNAGADGSISEITVSDWLKNSGALSGTIEDSSNLADIKNVKGEESFTQNGSSVKWAASDQDIYYQGKSSGGLPVSLNISYSLDGEEMPAKDMVGKSGEVEIKVSYENKSKTEKKVDGKDIEVYTPFAMVTGIVLDNDKFSDVDIDNGKVVNEGDRSIVVGIGLPGLAESLDLDDEHADDIKSEFTVTANVEDFSMGNTFTFVSPSLLDELDLDDIEEIDDLEEKLDDLTDAAGKLVDGSEDMLDGMSTYADKMGELKTSVKEYQEDGVKKLTNGIAALSKNGPKLKKGTEAYTDGAAGLADGANAYVAGAKQIADGNIALYNAVKDMPSQLSAFDKGLRSYTSAIDQMGTKENVSQMKNGARALSTGVTTLNTTLGTLEESYANNEAALEALAPLKDMGDPAVKQALEGLEQLTLQQKTAITQLKAATSEESELKKGADSLSAGVDTVMDGLSTLSGKSPELTGASTQINKNIPQLVSNIKKLKEGSATLKKSNTALTSGAKKLKKSGKTLRSSTKKLNQGMQSLQKGGQELNKATNKLVNGVVQLEDASGTLEEGSDKLHRNLKKFKKKGVQKLNDVYENDIQKMLDRLDAVISAGKDYKSYSGLGKGMDGDVKFVIETEAIEKD